MWLFNLLFKYTLPVTIALLIAQNSPLGIKSGTLLVAIILTVVSIPQFLWLGFRFGSAMLMAKTRKALILLIEMGILALVTGFLWIYLATIY